MNGFTCNRKGLTVLLVALMLALPGLALAAADTGQEDEELDEVVVQGYKHIKDPDQKTIDWMARLVGRFVVEGNVDLHGQGNADDQRKVQGQTDCIGFGQAPGVECELRVRWPETKGPDGEEIPGGISTLNPAMMVFGFEPLSGGVQYILVDNKGIAETAVGRLATVNTLESSEKCVAIPGNCQRVVQITAKPDLKVVEMKIDLAIDFRKAVSFTLVMRRVAGSPAVVYPGKKK